MGETGARRFSQEGLKFRIAMLSGSATDLAALPSKVPG